MVASYGSPAPVWAVHTRTPAPKASTISAEFTRKNLGVFLHCFPAVAAMTQALQLPMEEHLEVSTVRHNVVNLCGSCPVSTLGALSAEGFAGQLILSPP